MLESSEGRDQWLKSPGMRWPGQVWPHPRSGWYLSFSKTSAAGGGEGGDPGGEGSAAAVAGSIPAVSSATASEAPLVLGGSSAASEEEGGCSGCCCGAVEVRARERRAEEEMSLKPDLRPEPRLLSCLATSACTAAADVAPLPSGEPSGGLLPVSAAAAPSCCTPCASAAAAAVAEEEEEEEASAVAWESAGTGSAERAAEASRCAALRTATAPRTSRRLSGRSMTWPRL